MGKGFEDLQVWQKAIGLCKFIYTLTADFPDSEKFGLISQMRRCAVSVASNIAEGASRGTDGDYARFLSISLGSSAELKTQCIIARELGFLNADKCSAAIAIIDEIAKMLQALKRSIQP